jgi:hypothetical protein
VATGLAVTGTGGDVLFIEATAMDGEPGLTLTGQLGDVMKESAQIALSYLRSHAHELGIDPATLAGRRLHLHVPAGAVPKDGPSAGITMATALASLVTGRPVRPEVGMTGEVTLAGRVLPIGGVKQKLLAAHRAGLTEVIIPARNEPDLDDVPAEVREGLKIRTLSDVADVLALALRPAEPAGLPPEAAPLPAAESRRATWAARRHGRPTRLSDPTAPRTINDLAVGYVGSPQGVGWSCAYQIRSFLDHAALQVLGGMLVVLMSAADAGSDHLTMPADSRLLCASGDHIPGT